MGTLTLTCMCLFLGQAADDVFYHNERAVRVPINIDASRRAELKALVLYASEDQGRTYHEVASILPSKDHFIFNARSDGSYWLKAAVINVVGKQEPENIQEGPPHRKFVIDTLKPQLRIVSAQRQGEEVAVAWEIREDHPDWPSFRLEYQVRDSTLAAWTSIQASAGFTGKAQFKPGNGSPLVIRLTFKDLAGNASTALAEVTGTVLTTGFTQDQKPGGAQKQTTPEIPAPLPPGSKTPDLILPPDSKKPEANKPASSEWEKVDQGKPGLPPPGDPWGSNPGNQAPVVGGDLSKPVATTEGGPNATPVPGLPQKKPQPPLQYVNHPNVMLEYEISKVGPSGIGKVEVWYTINDGQSWELCADDPLSEGAKAGGKHTRSIQLPGDGVYGFHLVVKSRAGLGKPPPRAGDVPQIRFEVDTSVPVAQLFAPVPDPQNPSALLLRWTAKDNNLTETPITLEWSEKREGPWTPIAANVANTGSHSWQLPDRMPVQAHLRIRVRDKAGNEGVAVSEPQLIDLSEPEGRLTNVTVNPKR